MIDRYRVVHCRSRLCSPAFVDDHCYRFYETRLLNLLKPLQIQLQAYCLLPGEVYLLVSPRTPLAVAHLLRALNRAYSEYFSIRFARTGRVWHSAYREIKLRQGQTLLDCQKYIERLPMRRLGYGHPGVHVWSSYCRNAFGKDRYLQPSPGIRKLRDGKRGSCARYRNFVASDFAPSYELYLEQLITTGKANAVQEPRCSVATSGLQPNPVFNTLGHAADLSGIAQAKTEGCVTLPVR